MAIVRRTNYLRNSTFTGGDLSLWSTFGGATVAPVQGSDTGWRARLTFPTAAAGVAGYGQTVTGLTAGVSYRLWIRVPSKSGTTTVQAEAQGVATGAAFATNDTLFKQGTLTFTATGSSVVVNLKSAIGSTSGDWVDVDFGILEETNAALTTYPYFDGTYPGAYFAGPANMSPSVWEKYDTDVPTTPMKIVEFDARPVSTYDFVLDRNSLDDTSVAIIDSPRWLHIPEAERVEIKRGRQDEDSEISNGQATITLRDYDGIYDPDNPATPLQINGVPVMRAGMRIRVSVVHYSLGVLIAAPLFTGSLDDVTIDRTYEPVTVVSAVDDLAKLSTSSVPSFDPAYGYGWITLYRVVWALGFAGIGLWDNTYGSNLSRQMLATTGGGTVLDELRKASNCEGGKVFAAADGRIHVGTHSDDFATTPAAVFTDSGTASTDLEFSSIETSTSIRTLINRSEVQRGNYTAPEDGAAAPTDAAPTVTAQDDNSVALNQRVWTETFDAPLLSDSDALALAQWRSTRRSRSATRVTSLKVLLSGQTAGAISASQLDISSVIRIKRYAFGRGIDDQYGVGGIEHSIDDTGRWEMTLYTEPLDITGLYADQPQPFFLDTSALDGADILSAY